MKLTFVTRYNIVTAAIDSAITIIGTATGTRP